MHRIILGSSPRWQGPSVLAYADGGPTPVRTNLARARTRGPSLPLSQVVLFSSGVGYFQRGGRVDGARMI